MSMFFSSSNRGRGLQGQVIDMLGRRIVKGDLRNVDGEAFREIELQRTYGASRSVIREAVKSLSAKGLIESRQRTGIRIRPQEHWNLFDPDVLGWQFDPPAEQGAVFSLVALRRIVEPAAAEMAAMHASPQDHARIAAAVAAMRASADELSTFNAADIEFHVAVFDATGNPYLARLGRSIATALLGTFRISASSAARALVAADKHEEVARAIAQRNAPVARATMSALIDQAVRDLNDVLESGEGGAP